MFLVVLCSFLLSNYWYAYASVFILLMSFGWPRNKACCLCDVSVYVGDATEVFKKETCIQGRRFGFIVCLWVSEVSSS